MPGLHPCRHAESAFEVSGEDRAVEPVDGVVGDRDGLLLVAVGQNRQHRTEDLLAHDAHVGCAAGEDRSVRRTSRARGPLVVHRRPRLARLRRCQRRCSSRRWSAGAERPSARSASSSSMGSPTGIERTRSTMRSTTSSCCDSWTSTRVLRLQTCPLLRNEPIRIASTAAVEVGVRKQDRRRLAAELERHSPQILTTSSRDGAACRRRAGERHLVDARMSRPGMHWPRDLRARR